MCFSASVSYSSSAILVATGLYALRQSSRLQPPYWMWAMVPLLFGIQQAFEGRVWQALLSGNAHFPFALGFHFFSHFLWLWWLPLCSYQIEPDPVSKTARLRKWIIGSCTIFGAFSGALTYAVILLHPEWLTVVIREHSIVYDFSVPWRSPINLPITSVMLYGLILLIPLLITSHRHIRIFGGLIALSMALSSVSYNAAFVSVWCFFAALLSLYIVSMIHRLADESKSISR